jgi:hypothetical protein
MTMSPWPSWLRRVLNALVRRVFASECDALRRLGGSGG